ncbi:hypothetical protein LTR36_007230 [Oleoguttula mirabilis]|uniref:BZIP domain-containing protein n=1 Tax=Oleoguttula mirabilis TaxID=1507867 RepID=A0AAV9JA86_9PEZI|nr:hypothetical protein LTR36_007230 [Oleoguttula mirabilis]
MNTDTTQTYDFERQQSHGYASSGSESRKPSGSSGKKRASRAGTRSVTTLSAAQLERKRANDREAQRAIRQRTKDHIDNLEKNLSDLRGSQESNEKLVATTQQRNHELEEENAYLRSKLGDTAGYSMIVPDANGATCSALDFSCSTHFRLRVKHPKALFDIISAEFVGDNVIVLHGQPVQSMQQAPIQVAETPSHQTPTPYGQSNAQSRVEWTSAPPSYQYPNHEQQQQQQQQQQQPHRYEAQPGPPPPPPPQQQQSYVQSSAQAFAPAPPHQAYHPPLLPPQAEFQNMSVSSPAAYQMQQQQQTYQQPQQPQAYPQQAFQQPTTYQMTPVQMPVSGPEYASPHGQMQPPPMSTSSYHGPPHEQHCAPPAQQPLPPAQYRDDAAARGYSVTHYPSG